ncbi:MAG TPA: hydroxyisourate hydrolase [Rhizobiales bacterium]|nr:hydroxyisourate hydrolase [Hyphomicrobiales bacterium]
MSQPEQGAGGYLTTHILDTSKGTPAAGVGIELFRLDGHERKLVATAVSNSDGRTETPLLAADSFSCGTYEIAFHAGKYLRSSTPGLPEDLFLDVIPVRFGVNDAASHYHVPLLISPYGYSTYRGS